MLRLVAGLLVVCTLGVAHADDKIMRAKAHSEAGRALYSIGDYEAALREFVIGYQLVQKPQFLINLGQTYRKLRRIDKAREMYTAYLAEVPEDDPHRQTVLQILGELAKEPATVPLLSAPPPTPPPTMAAPTALVQPATPRRRFDRRHLGWILPVTALVLSGVGVGIYFAVRPGDGCRPGLVCVDSTMHTP